MLTQRNLSIRQLLAFAIVLVLGIAVGTASIIAQIRHDAIARRTQELENTAGLLATGMDQDFKSLELLQQSITDFVRQSKSDDVHASDVMKSTVLRSLMAERITLLPNITGASIFNEEGTLINATRVWPVPAGRKADPQFFRSIKSAPADVAVVSSLIPNFVDGAPIFMVARKLTTESGEFLGAIASGFGAKYLSRSIGLPNLTKDNVITLLRNDGVVLARYPSLPRENNESDPGEIISLHQADELSAEHRLETLPLKIIVTTSKTAALAEWRQQTQLHLITASLIVLLVCTIFAAILRRLRRNYGKIEQLIRDERNLLGTAINSMSHGLVMYGPDARILVVNQKYLEMHGLAADVAKPGITFRELIGLRKATGTFSGDVDAYCDAIQGEISRGKAARLLATTSDGRFIQVSNSPIEGGGWIALLEDITEQRQAEIERDQSKKFLDQIIDQVPVTIIVKKAIERTFVLINRQAEKMWGVSRSDALGRTSREMFSSAQADVIDEADGAVLSADTPLFLEAHPSAVGGKKRVVTSKRSTIQDDAGNPQYIISVVEDVTERLEAESRIAHLAYHDALTDLPNRASFRDRLEGLFGNPAGGKSFALLYLDLDNFKNINDSLGHFAGDLVLKEAAKRLLGCITETEFVARLGGDEFAIVKTGFVHASDVTDLLKRIFDAFEAPCDIPGQQVLLRTSVGIALAPTDGRDADSILKNADLALYGAKSDGRNTFRFFEKEMDARVKERRTLEADLRKAEVEEEFEVHYQPIINLKTGSIVSCEALLRWRHPERGLIPPSVFIPLAEECGFITQIGEWVLRTACREAARWPENIRIGVNVSSVQFRSQTLVSTVSAALAESGLAADRLELELTESVLIRDDDQALETLNKFREMGIRIAMDDFGTGYSSLSYLKRFPFDKIKIDRSFIQDVADSDQARTIIQAVIIIAKSRDITTTAEGVETREQRDFLAAMGCTEMQGFLHSAAKPPEEIRRLFLRSVAA
jgi:diguanylate cyclase (GGDEF)-like protein/PAS domain S-box-containing protein